MSPKPSIDDLKSSLKDILRGLTRDVGADLRSADVKNYIEDMAKDLATYVSLAVSGSTRAKANLRHLKAQSLLVTAIVKGRVAKTAMASFQSAIDVVAKTAVAVLKKALI